MNRQASSTASSAEKTLLNALEQQQAVFEESSRFLSQMLSSLKPSTALSSAAMSDIQKWLTRIAAAQQVAGGARIDFEQTGTLISASGQTELAEREYALRQFQTTVDDVLDELKTRRSELVPHLDTEVRRRSMHSAYQTSLKTR